MCKKAKDIIYAKAQASYKNGKNSGNYQDNSSNHRLPILIRRMDCSLQSWS